LSSFITTNATQAVFDRVLARPILTPSGEHPRLAHLWWSAPSQGNRLVQVYVQGELYDVTLDVTQREIYLDLDRTHTNRIELLAVPADDPQALWRPQQNLLASWSPSVASTAEVSLVRDELLATDTQVVVSIDGSDMDHGSMWPSDVSRSGFGALLGMGCFGFDDTTGPGLGIGDLGAGSLGVDGFSWRWRRGDLGQGVYDIDLTTVNHAGQTVANPLNFQNVTLDDLPEPVAGLTLDENFTLSWTPPNQES
jgi:hypothetical protein